MILDAHVKMIPTWWKFIPFLGVEIATTIYPYIYLPKDMYVDLISENPSILNMSVLIHEKVHIDRQIQHGSILLWNINYLLIPKFRLDEEIVAIREQMVFLKKHGKKYDYERKAQQFSSSTYLWVLPYKKSIELLMSLWSE